MHRLNKLPGKDFTVLNLTDLHWDARGWREGMPVWKPGVWEYDILTSTVKELVAKTAPDLITVSGDLAWAQTVESYAQTADFLDSFGIPWAPVWGNHDHEDGDAFLAQAAAELEKHRLCLFRRGAPELGSGNYVLRIEEAGKPIAALVMLDSHNREYITHPDGSRQYAWAKLLPEQLQWYRDTCKALAAAGCAHIAAIMHIPIHGYLRALEAVMRPDTDPKLVTLAQSAAGECWNEGYKDSFGVHHEPDGICCHPLEDGALECMRRTGTELILSGHDHMSNWCVRYQGIRFVYALKTGPGAYWSPELNGGTVLRISDRGIIPEHIYIAK